jgi:hypothetical protein
MVGRSAQVARTMWTGQTCGVQQNAATTGEFHEVVLSLNLNKL